MSLPCWCFSSMRDLLVLWPFRSQYYISGDILKKWAARQPQRHRNISYISGHPPKISCQATSNDLKWLSSLGVRGVRSKIWGSSMRDLCVIYAWSMRDLCGIFSDFFWNYAGTLEGLARFHLRRMSIRDILRIWAARPPRRRGNISSLSGNAVICLKHSQKLASKLP